MERTKESMLDRATLLADRQTAEVEFHKKLNVQIIAFGLPSYLIFSTICHQIGSYLQALLYLIIGFNMLVAVAVGYRINDVKRSILLIQVAATIHFGIWGISFVFGLTSDLIYLFIPWILIYPIAAMLFLGQRIGLLYSLVFSVVIAGIILTVDLPPWTDLSARSFKLGSVSALFIMLAVAFTFEKNRVQMRNRLLYARNKYKAAEETQRKTNLELQNEIELRIQSEKALTQSEARYRTLFEESTVSLWEEDWSVVKGLIDRFPRKPTDDLRAYLANNPDDKKACFDLIRVTDINRATLFLYEAESKSALLKHVMQILPPRTMDWMADRFAAIYSTGHFDDELSVKTLKGKVLHLLVKSAVISGCEESWEKVYTAVYNITEKVAIEQEKKRLEQQTQHNRQIQAIASLAGGIAHQFNNALAAIFGNLDLIELNMDKDDENMRHIGILRNASERMRTLTEQLLAYAQGGKYHPKDFSANALIQELLNNSKVVRDSSIKFSTRFDQAVLVAGGDITQIRIVLEAIITNAVESMNDVGEITISTYNRVITTGTMVSEIMLKPGNYALISIEDQGAGMDPQTCRRIFEPFFSTKFIGRGLGLAAAFGIIRNHDGMIHVTSKLNLGTCVTIYLPGITPPEKN